MNLLQSVLDQPTYMLWLILGLLFLGASLLVPEPTIASLGLAAIITAIAAITVTNPGLQMLIWGILAITLTLLLRGMVPKESTELNPASEAEVCVTIPRDGIGEVTYEGSYWSARCQISDISIPAGQTVHVVGRQGNTLIVLPATFPENNAYNRPV